MTSLTTPDASETSERVAALLREHPVLDGHNDLPWAARKLDYDFDRLDLADSEVCAGLGTHTDLPRLRAGGVGGMRRRGRRTRPRRRICRWCFIPRRGGSIPPFLGRCLRVVRGRHANL